MSIYYHGTNEENAGNILRCGFREGTYFTWDLHSALVMGGMFVFGVFFDDKGPDRSHWEHITPVPISSDKILFLRRFDVECLYDNDKESERIREKNHREDYGEDIVHCANCKGTGQLNPAPKYAWMVYSELIVCPICKGHGYTHAHEKRADNHEG